MSPTYPRGSLALVTCLTVAAGSVACSKESETRKPAVAPATDQAPVEKPAGKSPDAPADKPLPAETPSANSAPPGYDAALTQGRADVEKQRYAEAVASFERALQVRPKDARALSELSFAAFKAGQLQKAKSVVYEAVEAAKGQPKLLGAALYNKGRIFEMLGQRANAAEAYRASVQVRPHKAVETRRAYFDSAVQPAPLGGPYASPSAVCSAIASDRETCDTGSEVEFVPGAPFKGWMMPDTHDVEDDQSRLTHLLLRVERGWYLLHGLTFSEQTFSERGIEPMRIVHERLLVRHWEETTIRADNGEGSMAYFRVSRLEYLTICGVGKSGTPSCTPSLVTKAEFDEEHATRDEYQPSFHIDLKDQNTVVLRAYQTHDATAEQLAPFVGTHTLKFP